MGEKIKMRTEGTFVEKIRERFKESFCIILLGISFVLLIFYINQGMFYESTDMQNLILIMIGSFGSYVYLMDLFFDKNRKVIMQRHLVIVIFVLLFLGFLSLVNITVKGIQIENMVYELPLIDSAVLFFLIFFLMFFLAFLMVDGIIALAKKVKKSRTVIKNEIIEVEEEEE